MANRNRNKFDFLNNVNSFRNAAIQNSSGHRWFRNVHRGTDIFQFLVTKLYWYYIVVIKQRTNPNTVLAIKKFWSSVNNWNQSVFFQVLAI